MWHVTPFILNIDCRDWSPAFVAQLTELVTISYAGLYILHRPHARCVEGEVAAVQSVFYQLSAHF